MRILSMFMLLTKEAKPFAFFNIVSLAFLVASLAFMMPVHSEYFRTGLVDPVPTWLPEMALMVISVLMLTCGVILDSVARSRLEQKRLIGLSVGRVRPGAAKGNAGSETAKTPSPRAKVRGKA